MADADQKIDDFEKVNLIAAGHASQVWEVRDAAGQSFAIKLLLPEAFKSIEQINVLKHEAKVGQLCEHPNIIRSIRFVKTKTHAYKLMELFKSPSLKVMLQNEPVAIHARFGRLVEQLSGALGYMHDKGWLHHDLKPDNVLFSKSSELKLIDFSLAMRRQGGLGKVFSGKVKVVQGTRTYIAPETIKKHYPTVQSDIYSLGVTLFEVLTGQPPFVAPNPNDLLVKHLSSKPPEPSFFNPNVTPEADKVILRMLAKKPANRQKDMAEVAAEFRSLKVFKQDPLELAASDEEKRKAAGLGLDAKGRLDSRADAARTAAGIAAPARPAARKPTAAALRAAARSDARAAAQGGSPQPAPYPGGQPAYPGYDPAAAWAAYGQPAYPQGYWPQYPPGQPDPQQAPVYYSYPQAGPQYGGQYPTAPPPPQADPPAAPQSEPAPPQAAPRPQSPAPRKAEKKPAAEQTAAMKKAGFSAGSGRSLNEKHPTQENVDPDTIPLMDADELPDVL